MCWDARQQSDSRTVVARCRDAKRCAAWAGRFRPRAADLCSHPIADVLSPRARMHAWTELGSVVQLRHSSHTLIIIPKNSRRLLIPGCPKMKLSDGILILQAFPVARLYPPIPNGQESDQQILVGFLVVTKFMDTPWFALTKNVFQSSKSRMTSSGNSRVAVFLTLSFDAVLSILSRKWRVMGMA